MDAKLYVGKVHVIEWLRAGDRPTGQELFAVLEPMASQANPKVEAAFYKTSTRDSFVQVIRDIEADFRASGRIPILHIETHGNNEGIGLDGSNCLMFTDLMDVLTPLNGLTGLRLVIVMAACQGIWTMQIFQPAMRSAAMSLVGPLRDVEDDEIARGLQAFYTGMFTHRNGDQAIREMNEAIKPGETTLGALHAEQLFRKVYRQFMMERCTPEALERRLDGWVAEWQQQARIDFGREFTAEQIAKARELGRAEIADHEKHFAEFRQHYFWIDLFPENNARFPVTLQDCLADTD